MDAGNAKSASLKSGRPWAWRGWFPSNQVLYVYKSNYCIYVYYNKHIYIYLHTSVMDCSGSKFKPQGTADVLAYDNCYSISHLIVGYYCVA
jgi:hypothetical protein